MKGQTGVSVASIQIRAAQTITAHIQRSANVASRVTRWQSQVVYSSSLLPTRMRPPLEPTPRVFVVRR